MHIYIKFLNICSPIEHFFWICIKFGNVFITPFDSNVNEFQIKFQNATSISDKYAFGQILAGGQTLEENESEDYCQWENLWNKYVECRL